MISLPSVTIGSQDFKIYESDSVLRQRLAVSIFIITDLSQFATVVMAVVVLS